MPVAPDAALIVTLGFDPATSERLDGMRARYFPPERNFLPAHVSLFHHLPGAHEADIDATLAEAAISSGSIPLTFAQARRMDRGFLIAVDAPKLAEVHARLARSFWAWLTPQDRQPFRAHVTIMNKADRDNAARAFDEVRAGWAPWRGIGDRLLLWEYRGGPWEPVASYPFSGTSDASGGDPA